jgi:hypothetical protein
MANEANQDNKVEVHATETHAAAPAGKPMSNEDYFAIGALAIGVISLCAWFIAICGLVVSVVGIVLGYLGLKSKDKATFAKVGLVLCVLGLLASLANMAFGVALAVSDLSY